MKLLAFTDVHGDRDALERVREKSVDADALIGAGDFTVFGSDLHDIVDEMEGFDKPVIVVHGNHEFREHFHDACAGRQNIKFVHEDHHHIDDLCFMGYGGGGFRQETEEFESIGDRLKEVMQGKKTVFIIHGPPYDTELDKLPSGHVGNKTIRRFIEDAKPDVVVCGHLHENFGKYDFIGETYVVNPGPEGRMIEL